MEPRECELPRVGSPHDGSRDARHRPDCARRRGRLPSASVPFFPCNRKGARNAGLSACPRPRAAMRLATRDCSHHGPPKPPAFRARRLRLAPQDPRRTSFQDRSPVLSTAAGRWQRPGQYDAAKSLRRHIPSDARCGASGPCGLGRHDPAHVLRQTAATAPCPASHDADQTPLAWSRMKRRIVLGRNRVKGSWSKFPSGSQKPRGKVQLTCS